MTAPGPAETPGFRDEVRAFLHDNLPAEWEGVGALPGTRRRDFVDRWRGLCAKAGMLGVTWPVEYGGRGLTKLDHLVVVEEFSRAKVPVGTPGDTLSMKLLGNTLAAWGTHEQSCDSCPASSVARTSGARVTRARGGLRPGQFADSCPSRR